MIYENGFLMSSEPPYYRTPIDPKRVKTNDATHAEQHPNPLYAFSSLFRKRESGLEAQREL
jgi:hypothetical protein